MDYTAILQELNKASLFDLHRLQCAIYQELINPKRASIKINEHSEWLVHYSQLFRVIEGETGDLQEQSYIPRDL